MKKYQKKICIITSSRADYGLLRNLIKKLYNSKKLIYHLSITGTHLSAKHGHTFKEILKDKIPVNSRLNILNYDDSDLGVSKSFSKGVIKFSKLFQKIKPNIIIILGDRFEILSAAIAATLNKIPIAHIHGGEETVGAIDNVIRHSITKLSHIHFTSTNDYKKRVIQMGENPKYVFNVGALGLEDIKNFNFKTKKYFKNKYNINFNRKTILVCFHPVTLEPKMEIIYIKKILSSLKNFENINIIFTSPNVDQGYKNIDDKIRFFSKKRKNCFYVKSFGRDDFLSCLKLSSLILGNSSAGIIEAPSLKTISINLGDRQKGRIKSNSVIHSPIEKQAIEKMIKKYLYKKVAINKNYFYNPYFKNGSTEKILKVLENIDIKKILKKHFFNRK